MKEVPKTNDDHNRDTEKVVTCPMLGEVVENSKCQKQVVMQSHHAKTNIRRKFPAMELQRLNPTPRHRKGIQHLGKVIL